MRSTWDFVYDNDIRNGNHYDPGNVIAMWSGRTDPCYPYLIPDYPIICNSFTNGFGNPYIFISQNNILSEDVVAHEIGHLFMLNANGWWHFALDCLEHYMFVKVSDNGSCAWSEGWADFLPLAANDDPCYDFKEDHCRGTKNVDYYDLEVHSRADDPNSYAWDYRVEGRVAAALYDLYDLDNEVYDSRWAGFIPISKIALGSTQITTINDFWASWIASDPQPTLSRLTFWWNTIIFNNVNLRQSFLPFGKK